MKLGCCINSFFKEGDPLGLGILPTLKALGYDYAEVSIAGFSDLSDEDFEKVASVVEKSSIPVEAGCILVTGGLNIYGDWEQVETYLHKAFSRASRLGLKTCEVPVTRAYPASGRTPTKISGMKGNSELMRVLLEAARGKYDPE